MNMDKLPVNLFDLALLAVVVIGILRGRKHGMSEELLNLVKWVVIVLGCAFLYEPGGRFLAASSPVSVLTAFLVVYAGVAVMILTIFGLFKHALGGKLLGSDFFGHAEYYLGMGAGLVRCLCILLAALALLNARLFTTQEVRASEAYQKDVYGSDLIPGLHSVQSIVFEKSLTGPWIKQNLGFLLIKPTVPQDKSLHQKEFNVAY
jgi:uncharacterized membrane protein required for colicin V production